ncbi:hypothetical protein GLOIN_2v1772930 [Rhizophagus irregularis DAOM 181602=DAOM 197198]|uniref:Uncharacterized protein n=1 Tax=Rhizophagus irregularis (strain DAOM 197198w) TaxID=1432141 RepID=A0A015LB67_RHIIW|nr:hypothetical protein RirG_093260 [Rhizophagus irregularis DAOM 197198w]GET50984.1 hypothetical protein GLOIN_2v1772930 [Rhizophagus irregularis DAOM 181602=DAOM 197198]CAG8616451.1 23129_t:CDS:2 [Rhizophagus irregularis]
MTDDNFNFNGNQYVSLKKQQLYYVNIRGLTNSRLLARVGLQSVSNHNIDTQEVDQENVISIGNPIIRRPKGRPPGTARFKGPLQTFNSTQ